MDLTVEVYKIDKRTKEGRVLSYKTDYTDVTLAQLERMYPRRPRYITMIHETWVTKQNLITGASYQERYDTPHSCSPSSETFWSM